METPLFKDEQNHNRKKKITRHMEILHFVKETNLIPEQLAPLKEYCKKQEKCLKNI